MAMKRNFDERSVTQPQPPNFVDLTLDSDEEPPTKRAKSDTTSITPIYEPTELHINHKPVQSPVRTIKVEPQSRQNEPHIHEKLPDFVLPDIEPIRFDTGILLSSTRIRKSPSRDLKNSQNRSECQTSLVHLSKPVPKPVTRPAQEIITSNVKPPVNNGQVNTCIRLNDQPNGIFKSTFRVNIPPLPSKQRPTDQARLTAAQRVEVISQLKKSADYARQNIRQIEALSGTNGFSTKYTLDTHDIPSQVSQKLIQKKRKKVKRDELDLGLENLTIGQPATAADEIEDKPLHPRRQARYVLRRRFGKGHTARLSFENRLNDRQLDGKFQFVDDYILSSRVTKKKLAPYPARACECSDGHCGRECGCFRQKVGDQEKINVQIPTYRRKTDGLAVLSEEFMSSDHDSIVIRECGPSCNCSSDCINRLTQKGRTIPLEIFMTEKCGFGVRAKQAIFRGQFLDFYLGEVVTEVELSKREDAVDEDTPSYVMSLDFFTESTAAASFYVDGSNFGSVTRFFNHSCKPNCKTFNVVLEGDSKLLYHIAFFATEVIEKGTELTIDYDPHLTLMASEDNTTELEDDVVRCECGQPNCRKRLWPKGKEKRRRKKRHHSESD